MCPCLSMLTPPGTLRSGLRTGDRLILDRAARVRAAVGWDTSSVGIMSAMTMIREPGCWLDGRGDGPFGEIAMPRGPPRQVRRGAAGRRCRSPAPAISMRARDPLLGVVVGDPEILPRSKARYCGLLRRRARAADFDRKARSGLLPLRVNADRVLVAVGRVERLRRKVRSDVDVPRLPYGCCTRQSRSPRPALGT